MANERVDVLAVMADARDVLATHGPDGTYALMNRLTLAGDAVAELIEADRELDAAVEAYNTAHVFCLGDREYVSADDPAVLRLDAAKARRAAALARVGGAP